MHTPFTFVCIAISFPVAVSFLLLQLIESWHICVCFGFSFDFGFHSSQFCYPLKIAYRHNFQFGHKTFCTILYLFLSLLSPSLSVAFAQFVKVITIIFGNFKNWIICVVSERILKNKKIASRTVIKSIHIYMGVYRYFFCVSLPLSLHSFVFGAVATFFCSWFGAMRA